MAKPDYKGWPDDQQLDAKPFDRLMPFHRIRVPPNRIILPTGPTPVNPTRLPREKVISGDAYSVGARSTKDYDAQFGKDLGKDLADLVKNIFPPLQAISAISIGISSALAGLLRLIPGAGSLADEIDGFDPIVKLMELIGSTFDALLVDSLIRSVPPWVPTFDEDVHPDFQLLEIDGLLIRSHQRIDSLPFWQWHRWYDWHFAVCPSPIFSELVGFGNTHRDDDNTLGAPEGSNLVNYHREGLPAGATVSALAIADCEWDIGAIGTRDGVVGKGPDNPDRFPVFFDELQPRVKHDWCWPMTGMFFWAIGRSVYDCSHASKNNARRTKKKDRKPQGQRPSEAERLDRGIHLNQLRPMKAIATARWEAFQFKENPKPVPAIQFMFYANIHLSSAGFADKSTPSKPRFQPLNAENYDFIVDLPTPVVTSKSEYPIGHTPDFALNTLVVQPRLVVDVNFDPFGQVGTQGTASGLMEDANDHTGNELTVAKAPKPIVQLFGGKPAEPPRQAHVQIPLKNNIGAENNAYGVLVSIGWLDPDGITAKKVKKVTVRLDSIRPQDADSDDDWNINIGVNGRWFNFRFKARQVASDTQKVDLASISGNRPVTIEMLLADEDLILVSAHGFEEDPFDTLIRLAPEFAGKSRPPKKAPQLKPPGQPLPTPADIGKFKADTLDRLKAFSDRILRDAAEVDVPTGTPDKTGKTPTTKVLVPMVGDEIEYDGGIDTDNDHRASLTARAMFLRLAVGNRFDANDMLGILDANTGDPLHQNPPARRDEDGNDTANPLVVSDVVGEVGIGKTKKCRVTAYKSQVVGRMGAMAYDPKKVDYTLFYDVTVEDLPEDKK